MKRLTIKDSNGCIDCGGTMAELGQEEYRKRYATRSVQAGIKLCQLEDIEDELGIELTTFFKYLFADKFYVIDVGNTIQERIFWSISETFVSVIDRKYPYGECTEILYFSDYGKKKVGGWALTMEELE